ncbi:major facilitator superfamily MFS_1 [Beutenbergia cavernae DSM 12333]|uniref:Major facilitator superfamily MFS_1 n=1 Tax=Beutenbergia cavernae (strain ATCC BAA-8 / DSM 12333 / CCUG 43141 / JCM 11478 / NBRC 16432 / NCIMB 13614 / HKI 0122) TaxID=471853 RepID=C5C2T0_BEUC1|nr:MFS transporter [Beutenbergia cavernae]ACQ81774.1 major facilitator superfamily MFS_1 [Beutenbergia cavernae DSM 12333]
MTTTPAERDTRWPAFAVCLGAGFMTLLDVSIVNVALPSIETSLDAGPSALQWIVAGYALSFGLALVPAGRLGDVYGRRTLFLVGLAAFIVTSAACGFATTDTMLAVTRIAQGFSAGILNPQVIGFIQDLFRGPERGRAFGLFGATIGVSTAIGPLVGGLLIAAFGAEQGWRSVFLVNVPIGLVLLPIAWRLLPRPRARASGVRLDGVGAALLGVAVLAIMYPFVTGAESSDGASTPWWLVAVGAAVLAVFAWWERRLERRGGSPVISAALLRIRSYTFGGAVTTLYFAGFSGIFLTSTLYLQQGLLLEPWEAGLVLTPFAVTGAVSAALGGRWVNVWGRRLVVVGIVIVLVGLVAVDVAVMRFDGDSAAWWVAGILAVAGFGNGVVISPNQTLTLAEVPVSSAGVAAGSLQTLQRVGAAIGLSITSGVFFTTLASSGDYSEAFALGIRIVLLFIVGSLGMAIADLARRSREPEPAPATAG